MDIGKRIRNLRKARDLSVKELAEQAYISDSYLRDIENGISNPSLDKLTTTCAALNISLSEFFGGVPALPGEIIRLVENAQQLTDEEIQLLTNFLESMIKRQKTE